MTIDWNSFFASMLISAPIYAFGFAAAKFHFAWTLGALAWHFGAGFVISLMPRDDDGYDDYDVK
jgi:hypothetical protein